MVISIAIWSIHCLADHFLRVSYVEFQLPGRRIALDSIELDHSLSGHVMRGTRSDEACYGRCTRAL